MQKELRGKLPTFYTEKDKYTTILTNDWDALLSTSAEKAINNWDVNYFYNFENLYMLDSYNNKEYVGLDLALTKGKTIDNHMMTYNAATPINDEAINLNYIKGIVNHTYYKKFPLSTFLLLVSLHSIPLNYQDENLVKFILSIDSAYKGYYASNAHFKKVYVNWLEELNLTSILDVLSRTDEKEFKVIKSKTATIGEHITIDKEGFLHFGKWNNQALDYLSNKIGFTIALPSGQFRKIKEFNNEPFTSSPKVNDYMLRTEVFSYNFTYKNNGKVSILK